MSTKTLMELGIISMRQNPPRIASNLVTYQHPSVPGLTVQVNPCPSIAGGSYWRDHWYHLHDRYDRVLVQDGTLPLRYGTFASYKATRLAWLLPFTGHPMVVNNDVDAGKYDQAQAMKDKFDLNLAYTSVVQLADPPTDPRARRAVDHLNVIASNMEGMGKVDTPHRVVMPWSVYHCYYLNWRFKTEGWNVVKTEEVNMINQTEVALIMLTMAAILAGVTVFFLYSLGRLVGIA